MRSVAIIHGIARHSIHAAHRTLSDMDLIGEVPRLNMSGDSAMPTCVYQPNTNTVLLSISKTCEMSDEQVDCTVKDAMAMCGCYREFQLNKRKWNQSQNKVRMQVPALAMHGGPRWRSIRASL